MALLRPSILSAFAALLVLPVAASAQSRWTVTIAPMSPVPVGSCAAVRVEVKDAETGQVPRNPSGDRVTIAEFDMTVSGGGSAPQYQDAYHLLACACQGGSVGATGVITATYPAAVLPQSMRVPGVTARGTGSFAIGKPDNSTFNPPGCVTPAIAPRLGAAATPNPATVTRTTAGTAIGTAPVSVPTQMPAPAPAPTAASPAVTSTTPIVKPGTMRAPESAPLKNPTGFAAKHVGDGNVVMGWNPMPGAISYRLDGPGFPSTGLSVTQARDAIYPNMPAGLHEWKLTAIYPGNNADYANPSIATAIVRLLPPHLQPWLSKNNGRGSPATVQAPAMPTRDLISPCTVPGSLMLYDAARSRGLGALMYQCGKPSSVPAVLGIRAWTDLPGLPLWADPTQFADEAIYGNSIDLGVGRRARCAQGPMTVPPFGITTTCYATAHGIVPGEPGFNDLNTITNPGEGTGDDFILAMVITKDPSGTTFLVLLRDSTGTGKFRAPFYGRLTDQVTLDTEGPKYVPHVCLSCHGGKYNATTRKVDGGSFLPLDPDLLAFRSTEEKAGQQEKLRKINAMIVNSAPTSAVASYIRGLYGNAVAIPGTIAKVDYVPQGWSEQSGFYRTLVKPYCATCHLAAPESWNFATWDNFNQNQGLIKAAVCNAHTMPHAELQFKSFWTKDTGDLYLPGLLATTLNWPGNSPGAPPSCP